MAFKAAVFPMHGKRERMSASDRATSYDLTNDTVNPPANTVSPAPVPSPKYELPASSPYSLPLQQRLPDGGLVPQPSQSVAPGPVPSVPPVVPSDNVSIYDGGTGLTLPAPGPLVASVPKLSPAVLVGGLVLLLLLVRR